MRRVGESIISCSGGEAKSHPKTFLRPSTELPAIVVETEMGYLISLPPSIQKNPVSKHNSVTCL